MSDLENNNGVTPCTSEDCSGCEGCGTDGEATVTLTLDDGTVQECAVLTIFPVDDKQYIALLPLDENGENDDGEVYIYRFQEVNGEPSLDNIKTTTSTRELQTLSTSFWMTLSTTSWLMQTTRTKRK